MLNRVRDSANAAVSKISSLPNSAIGATTTAALSRMGSITKQAASAISATANEAVVLMTKNVKILDDKELFTESLGIEFEVKGTGCVFINRIVEGSAAALSSCLALGDEVISIDGSPVTDPDRGEYDGVAWLQKQLSGEPGSPIWIENAPRGPLPACQVCLVRHAYAQQSETNENDAADAGVELDAEDSSSAGLRVASLIPGGSAWLAAQSRCGDGVFLARGDRILQVNGVRIENLQQGVKLLSYSSSRSFTRLFLDISREGEKLTMELISRPRLSSQAIEVALQYKAEVARWPAMPPSLRSARKKLMMLEKMMDETPPIRGIVTVEGGGQAVPVAIAVAHATMLDGCLTLSGSQPYSSVDSQQGMDGRGDVWSEERRWASAALFCCLLGRLQAARGASVALTDGYGEGHEAAAEASGTDEARGAVPEVEEVTGPEWEEEFGRGLEELFGVPEPRRAALRHLVRESAVAPSYYAALVLTCPAHGTCPGKSGDRRQQATEAAWAVCFAVLACAVARPHRRAGSTAHRQYDARARALLRRTAAELGVPWVWVAAAEAAFSEELARLAAPPADDAEASAGSAARGSWRGGALRRYAAIGTAAVAGGTVIGLTGGMAVPAVLAGLGVAGSLVGVGGSLAAGAAAFGGLGAVVGVSFGAAGAGLVGYKVAQRTGDVTEFAFDLVESGPGLSVTIGVAGWLCSSSDSPSKAWDLALSDVSADGGECAALRWESDALRRLGTALSSFVLNQLQGHVTDVVGTLVLGAAYGSLAWPLAVLAAADVLDGPWAVAQQRADRAGEMLADALVGRAHGHRPVTLVGYGMGARLVLQCLLHLRRRGPAGEGIVETAVCFGTPFSADPDTWHRASQACAHRLVNAYCRRDWVLALIYRSSSLTRAVAGLQPIAGCEGDASSSALQNLDVTALVQGHWQYRDRLLELVQLVGLSSGVALPPPPFVPDD